MRSQTSGFVNALLEWMFLDGSAPTCVEQADADDDGNISGLVDTIYLLVWAFLGGEAPPAPGPDVCGVDPTDDDFECTDSDCQ